MVVLTLVGCVVDATWETVVPFPSTVQAVWEYRLQVLLDEAARERLMAAARPRYQEKIMFGEDHHDALIQRGINDALGCQDMLARAPVPPSLITRVLARLAATLGGLARRPRLRPKPGPAGRSAMIPDRDGMAPLRQARW